MVDVHLLIGPEARPNEGGSVVNVAYVHSAAGGAYVHTHMVSPGTTALAAVPFAGYAIVAAIASGYTIRRVYRQCAGCARRGAEQRHDVSDGVLYDTPVAYGA